MKNNQSGRSMVEMLGVLAIIGVLSAGGLAGYSKAMFKHKLNTTMDQITMLVTNIRTMYGTQGNYDGLSSRQAVNLGIVPAVMIGDGNDAVADDPNTDGDQSKAEAQALTNPFKGNVSITTYDFQGVTKSGFKLTYDGLPKEACIALATADFGSGAGSGFIGVVTPTANAPATTEGNAYPMGGNDGAISKCTESASITWFFY